MIDAQRCVHLVDEKLEFIIEEPIAIKSDHNLIYTLREIDVVLPLSITYNIENKIEKDKAKFF